MILRPFGLVYLCAILLFGASSGVPRAAQAAEHRIALVIGEADYKAGPLSTPANDAGVIAQALASDGFDVTGYANLDLANSRRALSDFLGKAREAGPETDVIVYLAGYGVQFGGDDFLVPVDARIARDVDVPAEAVRLSDFARDLAALPLKARVLVYDLARQHPFATAGTPLASGLAIAGPQVGSLVAFNTAPGLVAPLEPGDYGLYAQALAEMLRTKGLGIDTVFSRLRARVNALSDGGAVPWSEGTLDTPLVVLPPATDAPSLLSPFRALMPGSATDAYWTAIQRDTLSGYSDVAKIYPRDPLSPRIAVLLAARREATTWAQTRRANSAAAYWTYMRRYPRGPHFADARRGLAGVPAALEPPPRFDPFVYNDLAPPRSDELALINRPFVLLDADDDAPVPPPATTIVPERRPEFYDRLPPLLAVTAGTLPLPVPLGVTAEPGRIVQPDFGAPSGSVVATEGVDKTGDPTLRQVGPDGKALSTAISSAGPNGGSLVTQTGPDNKPVLKTVAIIGQNGGRHVTQTGSNGQVMATTTTVVAATGNRVTTVAGPDGVPRSIVTTTADGMVLQAQGAPIRVAASLIRPVVLPAKSAAVPAEPPRLVTGPVPDVSHAVPPSAAGAPPSSSKLPASAPVVDLAPKMPPIMVVPNVLVAPVTPIVPSIAPTVVPEPSVPAMPAMAPLAPMPPIAPIKPVPPQAPMGSPAVAAPTPSVPSPIAAPPAPSPKLLEPNQEPAAVAEPVPPRKGPEPVTAKGPQLSAPGASREKAATRTPSQPTPPRRPQAKAVKAPAKAAGPAKAGSPPRAVAKKPPLKKTARPRR